MIIVLKEIATDQDIQQASEHYPNYVKITIDIDNQLVAIGGEYHADAEQELLKLGANNRVIWGGGFDLITKQIETNAMINIKVPENPNPEILDTVIRKKFILIAKKFLSNHAK